MSISFTITTSIFVLALFHVGAENRNHTRAIDVDTIYNFEVVGINSIASERSSTVTIIIPSRGSTHTAFNLLVIAFNLGNKTTNDLRSTVPHCFVKAYYLIYECSSTIKSHEATRLFFPSIVSKLK